MICCQNHYCHHLGPRQSEDRQNELPQHLSPSAPDPDFEKIIPSTLDVPSSLDNPAFFQMPTHFLTNKKTISPLCSQVEVYLPTTDPPFLCSTGRFCT